MTKPKHQDIDIILIVIVVISILITTLLDAIQCLISLTLSASTPSPTKRESQFSDTTPTSSGKVKTQQAASAKNQEVTSAIAAKELGLPPGTTLTEQAFNAVRKQAGQAYKAIANSLPVMKVDSAWKSFVQDPPTARCILNKVVDIPKLIFA